MTDAKPDLFDSAEYYTCREPDILETEDPEGAIQEYLDLEYVEGCGGIPALIRRLSPITVRAFARRKLDPKGTLAQSLAIRFADDIAQDFSENEYGDPEDDPSGHGFTNAVLAEIAADLLPAIKRGLARGHVWSCDEVAKREYSAEEVEALMREHCPEWFEGEEDES